MVFGKLKQRLSASAKQQQSNHSNNNVSLSTSERGRIKGVGQTERLVSRAERIKQKKAAAAAAAGTKAVEAPKLNGSGHLTMEEVVKRTSSSVVTRDLLVGTKEEPIHVEVRASVV